MEPIKYAKNCSGNLYKIDDFKTETNDLALFKKELFSNLKNQLDEKNDLIKKIFLGTSDGSLNVGLNSILIDSMLRVVFKKIYHKIFNNTDYIFSIIAVGGYGRGELAPCSDLDLLFLLPNNLKINQSKHAEEVIQFILYILWDLGYSVGHSTRTIDVCIEKSKLDLTISTALLEKRFIVGNEDVFSLLNHKFTFFIKNTKTLKFVEAKLVESELRHKRFGGSRYVVEPNVKDGKGGLRDLRLFVKNKEVLSENPVNIIKLFNISHNKNIDIHPKTLRYLTSLQRLINHEVRHDFDANKMFLDILTSDKDSTRTLRLMNESNILGKFIPEFQKIVGLMQFDMYHSYTVDEHTIFTISNLYSLKNGEFKNFAPLASKVILEISTKKCLFVAMLLHDIAKGRKGDHSENGALIASVVCPRLGLSKEETKTVEWLIFYHLLMSKTAFRYELGDARVIKSFVDKVEVS